MQNPSTIRGPRLFTCMKLPTRVSTLIIAATMAVCGCGAGSTYSPTPSPPSVAQDASVTGQYNLVLTSTNGRGTTNIYSDFTQSGKTSVGAANTLVCPTNDLSQCEGDNSAGISISPTGTVKGTDVTLMISVPSTTGTDIVTMVGTATGTNLAGTYTDSLGDAGTWTVSAVASVSGTYNGTFNSTSKPLLIAPTIVLTLSQDPSLNLGNSDHHEFAVHQFSYFVGTSDWRGVYLE